MAWPSGECRLSRFRVCSRRCFFAYNCTGGAPSVATDLSEPSQAQAVALPAGSPAALPLQQPAMTPMRLLLINPKFPESSWSFKWAINDILPGKRSVKPSLGLATLAALCPSDWQVQIVEEDIETVPPEPAADIVGICGLRSQSSLQGRSLGWIDSYSVPLLPTEGAGGAVPLIPDTMSAGMRTDDCGIVAVVTRAAWGWTIQGHFELYSNFRHVNGRDRGVDQEAGP